MPISNNAAALANSIIADALRVALVDTSWNQNILRERAANEAFALAMEAGIAVTAAEAIAERAAEALMAELEG